MYEMNDDEGLVNTAEHHFEGVHIVDDACVRAKQMNFRRSIRIDVQ